MPPPEEINGIVIEPNQVFERKIPNKLSAWQEFVGGWVEGHHLNFPGKDWPFTIGAKILMNEEGALGNPPLPINRVASRIFGRYSGKNEVPIYGTVIIFGMEDNRGNYTNINPEIVEWVMGIAKEML